MPQPPSASPYLNHAILDNAVALVTSAHAGQTNVMTLTFFAESSHVPALLRIAVAPTCWTHELITASGWFGLHVLACGQADLALRCGTVSGRQGPKLDLLRLPVRSGPQGIPLLPGCLTTSVCRVVERVELPGHTLFVGEITTSYRQTTLSYLPTLLVSDLLALRPS